MNTAVRGSSNASYTMRPTLNDTIFLVSKVDADEFLKN
jgi:hypothetical protein